MGSWRQACSMTSIPSKDEGLAPGLLPPSQDSPPWGFIEWSVSALSAFIVFMGGFLLRLRLRLSQHETELKVFSDEIKRLREDHEKTKEYLAKQPTKEDISEIRDIIETRFDQLNTRLDRLDSRVDGFSRHVR
jgi:hypothetical protein